MKKLDWYIIRKFLGTFFFMIGAFCVIAVVFDLSENIDDLITNEAPLKEIFIDYYLNFFFYFGNMLSAFIVFLTIILFTSRLAQNSEIIAILSSGISFRRLMYPYFLASTFLVVLSLVIAHVVLPYANKAKVNFEFKYIHVNFYISDEHLYREIAPGTIAYFKSITADRNVGYKFALENWEDGKLRKKLMASKASYNEEQHTWTITDARIRTIYPDGSESLVLRQSIDTALNMKITDFGQRAELMSTMNNRELNEYIEKEKQRGSGNVSFIEIEKYSRTSNAFAIYVLTLIGVSIASRKVRGGTGFHLFMGVVVGLTYVFCQKLATVAATNVGLPAAVAVWVPNFLFLLLGMIIYYRAPK